MLSEYLARYAHGESAVFDVMVTCACDVHAFGNVDHATGQLSPVSAAP
jgi:hypothetical protein